MSNCRLSRKYGAPPTLCRLTEYLVPVSWSYLRGTVKHQFPPRRVPAGACTEPPTSRVIGTLRGPFLLHGFMFLSRLKFVHRFRLFTGK